MLNSVEWDLVLKALGFVGSAVVAFVQIRNLRITSRTSLKTDLEILNLLDAGDPNHDLLKRTIDARIRRLYGPSVVEEEATEGRRWALAGFGLVWALIFSYWTFTLVQPGFTWWAILTGYLALAGLGWMVMGLARTGFGLDRRDEARPAGERPAAAGRA